MCVCVPINSEKAQLFDIFEAAREWGGRRDMLSVRVFVMCERLRERVYAVYYVH